MQGDMMSKLKTITVQQIMAVLAKVEEEPCRKDCRFDLESTLEGTVVARLNICYGFTPCAWKEMNK
jgi:hypothetical protein